MATRSTIAVEHEDGTVSQIYCNWDGYPEYNGKILLEHYTTLEKVEELIGHGDLSTLASNINPTGEHSDGCVFYGRDHGEDDTNARKHRDVTMYRLAKEWQEYNYLFKSGEWYLVPTSHSSKELIPLISVFEAG